MFRTEFTTWRRASAVNPAGNRLPQFSFQGNATGRLPVRPPHADQRRCQRDHILTGYALMPGKRAPRKFGVMKIDPKCRTAGSAGLARRIVFRLACHGNLSSSILSIPKPFLICDARPIERCRSTPSRPRFPFDPRPGSAVRDRPRTLRPATPPCDPSGIHSRKRKDHRPYLPE